jgi:hypothetical protein
MGDDVTSGEKAPLGWILSNLRLRMHTPKGSPFGWPSVRGHDRKWHQSRDPDRNRKWMHALAKQFTAVFFLTIVVVQHMSLRMTERATGSHVTPKVIPLGLCMRKRKLKLRYIRPSGAFWPEMTLWNLTHSPHCFPTNVALFVFIYYSHTTTHYTDSNCPFSILKLFLCHKG